MSTIFILIFYQTFSSCPVLEEAARLDGASDLRIFEVAVPAAILYIISIIFSTVWYWNETYLTVIFHEGASKPSPAYPSLSRKPARLEW